MDVVDCATVQQLVSRGAQLVEVLPREEFEWAHLPGAEHVPLADLDDDATKGLDRRRPVIAYCNDFLCDLSPRAAWRLEQLGFTDVTDYAGGKMDWLAHGLPYDGTADLVARHLRLAPTCRPDEPIAAIADRVGDAGLCVVVSFGGIVAGTLDENALRDGNGTADDVAEPGPSTVRPSEERSALDERMAKHHLDRIVVTDPTGRLLGLYEASSS